MATTREGGSAGAHVISYTQGAPAFITKQNMHCIFIIMFIRTGGIISCGRLLLAMDPTEGAPHEYGTTGARLVTGCGTTQPATAALPMLMPLYRC